MRPRFCLATSFLLGTLLLSPLLLNGCMSFLPPLETQPATHGPVTEAGRKLHAIPEPSEKIVTAVYKFRDQTGQYKQASTGSTFSTAVTQGATSILIQILDESGWFIPIEREGLSNLLNERKIIRSSRAEFLGNQEKAEEGALRLPPLLFAGIIIEGGVISYETNLLTGGIGVKYFGIGASEEYRLDRVTIYLRAVSSQNGRILKTVHTSKTILSQSSNAGLYRFVDYQRLLEAETGFSYNEPPEICLREALEKAVESLIIEGVFDNLWTFKDPSEADGQVVRDYLSEKKYAEKLDPAGLRLRRPETMHAMVGIGGQEFRGDYLASEYETPVFGELEYRPPGGSHAFGIRGSYYQRKLDGVLSDDILSFGASIKYYIMGQHAMQPYVAAGLEYLAITNTFTASGIGDAPSSVLVMPLRFGLRYQLMPVVDLTIESTFVVGLNDRQDRAEAGRWNDYTMGVACGVGISIP
ncbi:MAG: curli production assembly/transport component CsgG [Bacteroidetes bacterium]|nr:curli production assembly/transport component CsgG [Bacteroidota bacterium]